MPKQPVAADIGTTWWASMPQGRLTTILGSGLGD